MNILDENILADQRELLQRWAIPFRQIGHEIGRSGMADAEIVPLLLELRRATFFTLGSGGSEIIRRTTCMFMTRTVGC